MPDREKVVKGLECHRIDTSHRINCSYCPYHCNEFMNGLNELHNDAIALLKNEKHFGGRMEEIKYFVELGGYRVAENMSIQTALILIEALFAEYYNDKQILISIRRMDWDQPECGET